MQNNRLTLLFHGLIHLFVMLGATITVPLLTGLDVGVSLFAAGLGTLVFHTFSKYPIFLGSSYAYLPQATILLGLSGSSLAEVRGGLVAVGLIYSIFALLTKDNRREVIRKIVPPHIAGSIILLIGLSLAPIAVALCSSSESKEITQNIGVAGSWMVGAFTFLVAGLTGVFFQKHFKILSLMSIVVALFLGYILCIVLGIVDFSFWAETKLFALPNFSLARFSMRSFFLVSPIALVTICEHYADLESVADACGKKHLTLPKTRGSLIADGLATSISTLIGGPVNTIYSENIQTAKSLNNFDPITLQIAAVFAILLSFFQPLTKLIGSIPDPVVGGVSIYIFGRIAAIGIGKLVKLRVNFNDPTVLITTSTILVLGIGQAKISFGEIHLAGVVLATIVGVVLNLFLRKTKFSN